MKLVYKEKAESRGKALSRECQVKSWRREKKVELIIGSASSRTRLLTPLGNLGRGIINLYIYVVFF